MTIMIHELRQGFKGLLIWTLSIGFLLVICVLMFPDMKDQMGDVSNMFASMGSFTEAFSMDRLNFGTLTGFYAVECGNILGLGGAFFAAFSASVILAKEEKEHTAEFLLTHPVSRGRVVAEKLMAVLLQILIMNLALWLMSVGSIAAIGETIPWKDIHLIHLSFLILQVELACVCFGISAFLRRGGVGLGLGIAGIMYFLNIIKNISDSADFLKYVTPFGYTEGADIISNGSLDMRLIAVGMVYAIVGVIVAFVKYTRKDIR